MASAHLISFFSEQYLVNAMSNGVYKSRWQIKPISNISWARKLFGHWQAQSRKVFQPTWNWLVWKHSCIIVSAVLWYDSNFKVDVLLSKFHNLGFLWCFKFFIQNLISVEVPTKTLHSRNGCFDTLQNSFQKCCHNMDILENVRYSKFQSVFF